MRTILARKTCEPDLGMSIDAVVRSRVIFCFSGDGELIYLIEQTHYGNNLEIKRSYTPASRSTIVSKNKNKNKNKTSYRTRIQGFIFRREVRSILYLNKELILTLGKKKYSTTALPEAYYGDFLNIAVIE